MWDLTPTPPYSVSVHKSTREIESLVLVGRIIIMSNKYFGRGRGDFDATFINFLLGQYLWCLVPPFYFQFIHYNST